MKKIRILVDLKPALDGYAGIPQESRLLFAGLKRLDSELQADGLLQHGSGFLSAGPADASLPPSEQIYRDSCTVVSFCRNGVKTYIPGLPKIAQRYLSLQELRWRSFIGQTIEMGHFETRMFDDFIWRHLFAKTLPVSDKELVTSSRFRVISHSRKHFHQVGLKSFSRHIKPRYLKLNTRDYDFLLAQTPFPARVSRRTKLIIRYHDAFPVLMPHTINDVSFHQASHYRALKQNVEDGALFVCASDAARADLVKMFPCLERRSLTIPNMVGGVFRPSVSSGRQVRNIIISRAADDDVSTHAGDMIFPDANKEEDGLEYLLMVSTLEPRKNHQTLISAWEKLKHAGMSRLKLVLVGGKGWKYDHVTKLMRPWQRRGELFHLTDVPADELAVLYSNARATICPSYAEGFDYSGIEAMRCGGLVISSDIPVHREIYGDGSAWFNPYDTNDAAMTIKRLLNNEQKERAALLQAAEKIADRYSAEKILPRWSDLLSRASRDETVNMT